MRSRQLNVGAGESVLFLHSSNTAGWMWGEQLPAFGEHHILVPDLPGFGENNDIEWCSLADTADQLATIIGRDAPAGRVHMIGLSLGASVAIELAARHPDRVLSLFLASAVLVPPNAAARISSSVMLALWNRPGYWRGTGRSYGLSGEDLELFITTGAGIERSTARRIYREFLPGTPRAKLAAVTAPTLCVAGTQDVAFVREESLRHLLSAMPDARSALAPGMHHHWNVEDAALFNRVALGWIRSRAIAEELQVST
jgi:pimeloyl-ACP methyl ester carboxylesterase